MIATIKKIEGNRVYCLVRRNYREEQLATPYAGYPDLKIGQRIEVKRVTNNPYLVRVQ